MRIRNFIFIHIILFLFLCLPVRAEKNKNIDNYLIGMTVTKSFAGNYDVILKLKNETEEQFKLKDLGNNSYALILPQTKSLIDEKDIFYESEHQDIKIVLSEKRDVTNKNNFYTKINFKTKDDTYVHVEAYAPKSSKTQVILNQNPEEQKKNKDFSFPDWLWYVPVIVLSVLCVTLLAKSDEDEAEHNKIKRINKKSTRKSKKIEEADDDDDVDFQSISDKVHNINGFISKNNDNAEDSLNDSDKIVDELVKFIIPENDLVLMPGVPELPGLEKRTDKTENTKIILKNVKIDLFDANNTSDVSKSSVPFIPEKMSLSERLKTKDLIKEADDIIFTEREAFFDTISPINDIPDSAENIKSQSDVASPENASSENNNNIEQDKYDKLINALKEALTEAHEVKPEDNQEPEIIDSFGISDTVGFNLVKYGEKISLAGNIEDKIFIIKTFKPEELKNETLFMEYCTQTPFSATYSVILNKFKALIKVSDTEISLIGEYD